MAVFKNTSKSNKSKNPGRLAWLKQKRLGIPYALPVVAGFGIIGVVTVLITSAASTTTLRVNLRNALSGGGVHTSFNVGTKNDMVLACDWDGNGTDTVGVYRFGTSQWFQKDRNGDGGRTTSLRYGLAGKDFPVCGDWNGDGKETVGVFRPHNRLWTLRNSNTPSSAGGKNIEFYYGLSTDIPVVGDWNGDGKTTIGVFRPHNGLWVLRNSNNASSAGGKNIQFRYGGPGDIPVTGDFNGDGKTDIGVVRAEGNQLRWLLRKSPSGGRHEISFLYGSKHSRPVVGAWNGGRTDYVGVVDLIAKKAAPPPAPTDNIHTCAASGKVLTTRSSGDPCVKIVESILVRDKLLSRADSTYDSATVSAVKKYQTKAKLKVDGYAGQCTMRHMAGTGHQNPASCNQNSGSNKVVNVTTRTSEPTRYNPGTTGVTDHYLNTPREFSAPSGYGNGVDFDRVHVMTKGKNYDFCVYVAKKYVGQPAPSLVGVKAYVRWKEGGRLVYDDNDPFAGPRFYSRARVKHVRTAGQQDIYQVCESYRVPAFVRHKDSYYGFMTAYLSGYYINARIIAK